MDSENRIKAKKCTTTANRLARNSASTKTMIEEYLKANEYFSKIIEKTRDDIHDCAINHNQLSVHYFNGRNYEASGFYCNEAIKVYQNSGIPYDDRDFRHLSELFVDLSDIYMHLMRPELAQESMIKATMAFRAIQEKKPDEIAIGDPEKNINQFREYIENKLCTPGYIHSAEFINHEQFLVNKHEEAQMIKMFSDITLTEINDYCSEIEKMMQNPQAELSPMLGPLSIDSPPDDNSCRNLAACYLRMTQKYLQEGSVSKVRATYRQAIDALQTIGAQNIYDQKIIKAIEKQIDCLNNADNMQLEPILAQNEKTSGSLIASIGMFGYSPPQTEEMNESYTEEMDI